MYYSQYCISVTPLLRPPQHICRCFLSQNLRSGSPDGAPHRWTSLPPAPAPAPLAPPCLDCSSGLYHGCPPTLHPPPGAPVGDHSTAHPPVAVPDLRAPPPPLPPTASITYLPTSAIGYIVLLPVLYLRDPSPTAPHSTFAGASLPPAPAPAPLAPPCLDCSSGLSHGCPPTLHPPPGAPVGDPTAALHLPPSPAAPVGDPTAALPPLPLTTRPIVPPAEWPSGQPHELLSGSRGFDSLPSPCTPNTQHRKCSKGSCTTRNCILPACITYLPTSAIGYIVL